MVDEIKVRMWVRLIQSGRKTLDDITDPELRDAVEKALS